jgi:endonuclease/exonuclease/phosphatase family metal-dependent hydrolase
MTSNDRDQATASDGSAPPRARDIPGAVVRVMTWNIHGGVGLDGRRDLQRIVDLVRRHDPDIVALQEVGSRRAMARTGEDYAFLTGTLGMHAIESRLITAPDGDFGHALISRWPLEGTVCHDISYRRREPRAAIEAVAQTPFGPLHVIAAHLGLSFAERRYQAVLLANLVQSGASPTILLGDLNDWIWRGSVQTMLNRLFPGHTHLKTYPCFWPVFALDRIYCRPSAMLLRSWTDTSARFASDHLPVIAELRMHKGNQA